MIAHSLIIIIHYLNKQIGWYFFIVYLFFIKITVKQQHLFCNTLLLLDRFLWKSQISYEINLDKKIDMM